MSWSFGVAKTPVADFEAAADAAAAAYKTTLAASDWQPTADASAGIDQAIAAAKAIAASGVVGTGNVTASLSGHATPGNVPVQGSSAPAVTVSITCADQYVAPVVAAADDAVVAEETAASPGSAGQ